MKNLILFLTVVVCTSCSITAQSHFSTKIGEVTANGPEITLNEKVLFEKWEDFLSEYCSVNVTFDTAIILTENNKYWIAGNNKSGDIQCAVPLVVDNGNIYELESAPGLSWSVTCTGCTSGCSPRGNDDGWYCKDPCATCEKSETLSDGGGGNGIWY